MLIIKLIILVPQFCNLTIKFVITICAPKIYCFLGELLGTDLFVFCHFLVLRLCFESIG